MMSDNVFNFNILNSKNKKKRGMKGRKGFMALEYGLGLGLSAVALLLVVKLISGMVLVDSDNEKIMNDNLQSIVGFVNYFGSGNVYSSQTGCYDVLKLSQLENFQFPEGKENGKNYFYVLDSTSVHVVKYNEFKKFSDDIEAGNKLDKYFEKTVDYGDGISLDLGYYEGSDLIKDLEDYIGFLEQDKIFEIGKFKPLNYIVLMPIISTSEEWSAKTFNKAFLKEYSQNKMELWFVSQKKKFSPYVKGQTIKTYSSIDFGDFEGISSLIYNPQKNQLFLIEDLEQEIHVKANICANDALFERDLKEYYLTRNIVTGELENLYDIDYINWNIIVELYKETDVDGSPTSKYKWSKNKVKCISSTCDDIKSSKTFKEFVDNINKKIKGKNSDYSTVKIQLEKLTQEEILENNVEISFDDIFEEYESEDVLGRSISCIELENKQKEFYNLDTGDKNLKTIKGWMISGNNYEFNSVEEDYSNLFYLKNGDVYFFIRESEEKKSCDVLYSFSRSSLKLDTFYVDSDKVRVPCNVNENILGFWGIKREELDFYGLRDMIDNKKKGYCEKTPILKDGRILYTINYAPNALDACSSNKNIKTKRDSNYASSWKNKCNVKTSIHNYLKLNILEKKYYKIKENFLRRNVEKNKLVFYLNGKKVKVEKANKEYDDINLYWLKIDTSEILGSEFVGETIDVLLSKKQIEKIPKINLAGGEK